jgi:hypothetical protein
MDKIDGNQREGDELVRESAWWELTEGQIIRVAGDSRVTTRVEGCKWKSLRAETHHVVYQGGGETLE